ncbi:MAG: hypothetical protein H7837_05170 [Magnetococcus sp. MYC-9]
MLLHRTGKGGRWRNGIALLLFLSLAALPRPLWSEESPFTVRGTVAKSQCRSCHGWRTPLAEQRPLGAPHAGLLLQHGKAALWCLACHIPEQPELLRSSHGGGLPFSAAHESCAVCHGRTVASWRAGVHGKRLLRWSGERVIQACSGCHTAHAPAVLPLTPLPPPRHPDRSADHG